jgi:hypothetical protein
MLHQMLNVWADLHDQYDDWLRAQRPELERQYQAFTPGSSETVAAACARFDALCLEMSEAQWVPISADSAIQHFLERLKRERPAWGQRMANGRLAVLPEAQLEKLSMGHVLGKSGARRWLSQLEVDEKVELGPGAALMPLAFTARAGSEMEAKVDALVTQMERVNRMLAANSAAAVLPQAAAAEAVPRPRPWPCCRPVLGRAAGAARARSTSREIAHTRPSERF